MGLTVATILYLLTAAGLAALAVRYLRAEPPLDYHAAILDRGGAAADAAARRLLGVLYRVIGGLALSLALGVALLSVVLLPQVPVATALALATMTAVAAAPMLTVVRGVERQTGVRTPWRPALALTLLAGLATLAALV